MSSSQLQVVPELSRYYKYQEYLRRHSDSNQIDKQPTCSHEDSDSQTHDTIEHCGTPSGHQSQSSVRCFEVRPSQNGVGMFATKPIAAGDIIIDSEEPIVSTAISLFPFQTSDSEDHILHQNSITRMEKGNDMDGKMSTTILGLY